MIIHLLFCRKCGRYFPEGEAKEKEVDLENENGVGDLFPNHHKAKRLACPACGSEDLGDGYFDESDLAELLNGGERND